MKTLKKWVMWLFSLLGVFLAVIGSASAALSTEVSTAFTGLQTDALALIDLAWPVVIAVTVGFIIIGLFKKAAHKAV